MTIHFFQDARAPGSGNHYTPACVQIELPCETAEELVEEIRQDPDLLEVFYQVVFSGLDENKSPGMRRVRADGFYLVTESNLEEAAMIGRNDPYAVGVFFKNLKKYKYAGGPYGPGDPFESSSRERAFLE